MSDTCPICDDAPGHHWLWRDDRLRVIDARDPDHPAFLRVIWNGHVREMTDLADADRDHLKNVVWQVERCVRGFGFRAKAQTLEVHGVCKQCGAA